MNLPSQLSVLVALLILTVALLGPLWGLWAWPGRLRWLAGVMCAWNAVAVWFWYLNEHSDDIDGNIKRSAVIALALVLDLLLLGVVGLYRWASRPRVVPAAVARRELRDADARRAAADRRRDGTPEHRSTSGGE